ncbi:hypothetical protein Pyn_35159 [Prunus yedoensis var. nudiflora]|uniref:Uncharacterized protein n=1 Tax=Prunus yedoensis var. nudiflora TaxID=2094558 RepID=A0A314Y919_PRUYE|nr:hypothetical protein Pyn_35159 [Prunus yedoensis var. nudiflora]
MVGKGQKVAAVPTDQSQTEAVKEQKNKYSSSESLVEKELGLTNLQITVEDLKRKVEITEKSKKGKGIEFENVKGQLEEADKTITKLFDVNQKLMNVEGGPLFSDGASGVVLNESGSVRRRRLPEQAKRGSEKIRRLQWEVQKLQFLLLKVAGEKESRGSTRITVQKTRVLLGDCIYGGNRTNQKCK